MSDNTQKILARTAAKDFIGRQSETEELFRFAQCATEENALMIFAAPSVGSSELLRQVFDRLFREQDAVIPFYFCFSKTDRNARQTAVRFLQTFLQQTVAFRRCNPHLLSIAPDVCEISELASPQDAAWIQKLVSNCQAESDLLDEASFVRTALSAPLRAHAGEAKVFVMLDDIHRIENITGETNFLEELKTILSRAEVPCVLAGRRRFMLRAMPAKRVKTLRLNAIGEAETAALIENLAKKSDVKINDQTRDLLIRQIGGKPYFINNFFNTAQKNGQSADSYNQVQTVINDSIFKGATGRYYDELFDEIVPQKDLQLRIIELLPETADAEFATLSLSVWQEKSGLPYEKIWKIIRALHIHEIVHVSGTKVEVSGENFLLEDYLTARYRTESLHEPRALAVGDALVNSLKRASQIMARFYRRTSAINIKELITAFNLQTVSSALFDYGLFKENPQENSSVMTLPQIVYAANTTAFYPRISSFAEPERSCVAIGFEAGEYLDETEIVWIVGQVDAKLEAEKAVAEFWCDRLEMVALSCNFLRYKLWLIAPAGFSPEACEMLRARGVFCSSHAQVKQLADELKAEKVFRETNERDEYEIILPMGGDTELIAAGAVEEIARRNGFNPKEINQIKTALVEACINAVEHSHSPDRKIYLKFAVEEEKIIITVANRGVKLPSEKISQSNEPIDPNEGRRGWGLKLMRTLMDDVKFEQTDDGTKITMIKIKQ